MSFNPEDSFEPKRNLSRYIMRCLRRRGGPNARDSQAEAVVPMLYRAVVSVFYCYVAGRFGRKAATDRIQDYLAELDTAMVSRDKLAEFRAASPRNRRLLKMLSDAMEATAAELYPPSDPGTLSIDKESDGEDGRPFRLDPAGRESDDDDPAFRAAVVDPDFIAEVVAMIPAIAEEYARLDPKYQEVLELVILDGMTLREAAAELGKSHTTVDSQLKRGKQLLKKRLAGHREHFESIEGQTVLRRKLR